MNEVIEKEEVVDEEVEEEQQVENEVEDEVEELAIQGREWRDETKIERDIQSM